MNDTSIVFAVFGVIVLLYLRLNGYETLPIQTSQVPALRIDSDETTDNTTILTACFMRRQYAEFLINYKLNLLDFKRAYRDDILMFV